MTPPSKAETPPTPPDPAPAPDPTPKTGTPGQLRARQDFADFAAWKKAGRPGAKTTSSVAPPPPPKPRSDSPPAGATPGLPTSPTLRPLKGYDRLYPGVFSRETKPSEPGK